MLIQETVIQFITVIYALVALLGVYLIAYVTYITNKKRDDTLLRARAFLSDSFMRDNWRLLFSACLFFLVHTVMELNEIFGLFIEESIAEFIKEITELGIAICIVLLAYKWFKLINPVKYSEQAPKQESGSTKVIAKGALKISQNKPYARK